MQNKPEKSFCFSEPDDAALISKGFIYPIPLQQAFAYLKYKPGDLPESESASREVLALPIFPEMSVGQQDLVVESIARFYGPAASVHVP